MVGKCSEKNHRTQVGSECAIFFFNQDNIFKDKVIQGVHMIDMV